MDKTVNNKHNKPLQPHILLQSKYSTFTISKDIIRCLGFPSYICFKINYKNNSMIIFPCKEDDDVSFKVPDNYLIDIKKPFRIVSRSFMRSIVKMNKLDTNFVYYLGGIYIPQQNLVLISLNENNRKIFDKYDKAD